ncbi:uncharacterized protein LOC131628715 [Vicia villosa]|uniref:uncharacterized protein LOC131628715 n=1 Tax=Vicia villosa TaxID=3911 RepID=UPI00273B4548|nr:uncharacterized protein LOC131628715 [Vicia villosa]
MAERQVDAHASGYKTHVSSPSSLSSRSRRGSPAHASPPPSSRRRVSSPIQTPEARETSQAQATLGELEASQSHAALEASQSQATEAAPTAPHGFKGGLLDLSLLSLYPDHVELYPLKFINHVRKITRLEDPNEPWFQKLLQLSGIRDLSKASYITADHGKLNAFVERWHMEMSSFHLTHGEMSITLDDVSCVLSSSD